MDGNFQDWTEVKWDKRGVRQATESKTDFIKRESMKDRRISGVLSSDKINKAGSLFEITKYLNEKNYRLYALYNNFCHSERRGGYYFATFIT
jgi:hypothetical protein